ncbi:MAG TPA: ice-binding family protein [Acidimicrobiales bacterium]|nr:ice-binding family protein [Acidimicrobiales bacterium]
MTIAVPRGAAAAAPVAVDLGAAGPFAILAGDSIGNTETGPITVVRGDLGVLAGAGLVTGFPPGLVHGTWHASGAAAVVAAHASLVEAYAEAAARASDFPLAGDLIGLTLHPGVHTNGGAVANTGTVTLDGDGNPDAVFIFQVGGALAMAAISSVVLANGTQAKNVFWQVDGAGAIGAGSQFAGTLMTATAIGVGANSTFNGRALAKTGAITTDSNQFYSAPPTVTIDGGSAAITTTDTPTLTGHTSVDLPASITVTIGSQVLTTAVQSDGAWAVTAALMANGAYPVSATVVDAVGNTGSDSQTLTVDTVPPVIGFDDGATRVTNDATPTFIGSSDVAPMSVVTLTVAGQTRTTLVQPDGSWNTTPTALADGTWTVTASVVDEAGNPASATQSLIIDTIAPSVKSVAVVPVGPKRVFDTRIGSSAGVLRTVPRAQIGLTNELEVQLTDLPGYVPAIGVGAVSLNVTVTNPQDSGFLTVHACGEREAISSVNFTTALTVANAVITPVSPSGTACFYASSLADIIVDINGWLPTGQAFTAVGPKRLFDTRIGANSQLLRAVAKAPIASDGMIEVSVIDLTGLVPATGVDSVSLNVTVTNPAAYGFLTVYACGTRTAVSSVNYVAGQTVANSVIAPISPLGTICLYAHSETDVIVDINGWFKASAGFAGFSPQRLLDTRVGAPDALRTVPKSKVGGDYILEVRATQLLGVVPSTGVSAVSLNVTVTDPSTAGFVTVYACGAREEVSSVNYSQGQTVANAVIAAVSSTGTICLFARGPTELIVDINGWFATAA